MKNKKIVLIFIAILLSHIPLLTFGTFGYDSDFCSNMQCESKHQQDCKDKDKYYKVQATEDCCFTLPSDFAGTSIPYLNQVKKELPFILFDWNDLGSIPDAVFQASCLSNTQANLSFPYSLYILHNKLIC